MNFAAEVIADRGYGKGENYRFCEQRGIRSYIPETIHKKNECLKKDLNTIERRNLFTCPQVHTLFPYENLDTRMKRYRLLGGHCSRCPVKETCLSGQDKKRTRFLVPSPLN